MRSSNLNGVTLALIFALITGMLLCTAVINAEAADDTAKQIERKLSKVKRGIATSPTRAEKEWIEAREMLTQLETSDPNHAKLSTLQKSIDQLGKKLAKRLGRPIGGSPPEVNKKESVQKKQTTPKGLPSSVASRLQKIDKALDAVETSLTKNQLQSATSKIKTAHKTMDEIEKRYSNKIPAGNKEMKAVTDRLAAVTEKVNQAQASAAEMAKAEADLRKQKEAQSQEWITKFSPFRDFHNESYLLMGSNFNSASKERQEKCRQAYAKANSLMAEYQKTEFPNGKTTNLLHMESGLLNILRNFNEGEAKDKQVEACSEWVEKLFT